MERIFLVELVEVLVTDLGSDLRNVTWSHVSHLVPIESVKERMRLDLIGSVSSKSSVSIANQLPQDVSGCWRELGFGGDLESLLPMHNLLTGD